MGRRTGVWPANGESWVEADREWCRGLWGPWLWQRGEEVRSAGGLRVRRPSVRDPSAWWVSPGARGPCVGLGALAGCQPGVG
ncbi:hypothetical protein NDU88_006108 [Pleurodeles waltl]|uniref:Uncharacterized protein n=1 Tax=Pleurodeles waltl TaxID=8319 RepID=A0AAV7NPE4_PLEWA|nr:hypothetical protein NDU88_006108 [Pleurodeles waltl]